MQAFYTSNETQKKKVVFVSAVLLVCCLLFSLSPPIFDHSVFEIPSLTLNHSEPGV